MIRQWAALMELCQTLQGCRVASSMSSTSVSDMHAAQPYPGFALLASNLDRSSIPRWKTVDSAPALFTLHLKLRNSPSAYELRPHSHQGSHPHSNTPIAIPCAKQLLGCGTPQARTTTSACRTTPCWWRPPSTQPAPTASVCRQSASFVGHR